MRGAARLGTAGLCILLGMPGAAASARPRRMAEFDVTISGSQTVTWSAAGTHEWCASASLGVPFEGSGSATMHLSGSETFPLAVGAPPTLALTLAGRTERTGGLVNRFREIASPPAECGTLPGGDETAESSGCGSAATALAVLLAPHGATEARLGSSQREGPAVTCPAIASVVAPSEEAFSAFSAAVRAHQEALEGLAQVSFPGLLAPRMPPVAATGVTGHASGSWQVPVPGGSLKVGTTSEFQASIVPAPMISAGHGIATIRVGESYSSLRLGSARYGGTGISDSGLCAGDGRHYTWLAEPGVPELDAHGNPIRERAWVSAPAGSRRGPLWHGPPPGGARVAQVSTTGSYETTASGAGEGSTLASLRRTEPKGHLVLFGRPLAWVLDGPGRRRTAFMLFGGIVQTVEVGCRQTEPSQRGAPVSDSAIC